MKIFALGCRKDLPDRRDLLMSAVLPPLLAPASIDYTSQMSAVRDQGDEGTCVAFAAVVGVKEYLDRKEYRTHILLSPRYLYHLCKQLDGVPEEEGTYPRVAMKVLLKQGVCLERLWPYRPHQRDDHKPGADRQAKTYRIAAYARIRGVEEMKRSLLANGPFLAGVQVFESWFKRRVQESGRIPLPAKEEQPQGGHAICIVGYDQHRESFKFKNSWGSTWADRGYGYLGFEYMRRYCMDAWSATDLIEEKA